MRAVKYILASLGVAAVVIAIAAYIVFPRDGFSAREAPSGFEAYLARTARRLAVPKAARNMKNPMPLTPELLRDARRHFADHCATCHANNGSGQTEIGQNLYPKAPNMRLPATQRLSDGDLYYIIHNGIRLTGMPAWGDESGHDHDSWALVHFIRHLPQLTPDELDDMERFNPQSEVERDENEDEEKFLNGDKAKPERKHP